MTDAMPFVQSPFGKLLFKKAQADLKRLGIPATSSETPALDDFIEAASAIMVPTSLATANDVSAPEMVRAQENFQKNLEFFLDNLAPDEAEDAAPSTSLTPGHAGGKASSASATVHVDGHVEGNAAFSFSRGAAGVDGNSSAGPSPEDPTSTKRPRLGMSDADLARACTVMDVPAARVTPQFLVNQPLDVRMYTPLLVELYASVRKVNEGIALLAREVLVFEGDFLEHSPTAVAALGTTQLFALCDVASGSRLLHRLESLHAAAALLRAKNLRCLLARQPHPRLQLGHVGATGPP
jgi:hypothetical protein